ncbi:MAG: DUF1232 domain-containing protein [Firmicutes bacterium]|nr:DUF1232 domain-containing protein [Bacillota bacterium]
MHHYSEAKFWQKVKKFCATAGVKVVYAALLLFYTLQESSVPKKVKATIIGALGYFISPFDALIDLTPIVGYTDDLGVLLLALGVAALYINDHVKAKARKKLCELFGEDAYTQMAEIDKKVS